MKRKAFTLAEIMIVLTVIGILSVILLPVAFNSTPDKNILKFKKAHNTLATAIRNMISSEQYFTPGDFGRKPDGTLITGYDEANTDVVVDNDFYYFGEALADNLSSKKFTKGTLGTDFFPLMISDAIASSESVLKARLDEDCKTFPNEASVPYTITLSDNTVIYIADNRQPFGSRFCGISLGAFCYRDPFDLSADFYSKSSSPSGFDTAVYPICIDIDGFGPINGFGYGIRRDGKIFNGLRAEWWLSRDITKKETDCCPKSLAEASNGASTINLCDTDDTVCAE